MPCQNVTLYLCQPGVICLEKARLTDHAVCLDLNFCWTLSFSTKLASSTQLWHIRTLTGQTVFNGVVYFGERHLWWHEAPLVRECHMWNRRCEQRVSHWFHGYECVSAENEQQYNGNNSYWGESDFLIQQHFTWGLPACYLQHLVSSCHILWARGASLWHWK